MQRHEQLGLFANLPKDIFLLLIRRYLGYGVFNLARASRALLTRLTTDETLKVTHFRDLTLLDAQIRNDLEILKQLYTINPIRRLLSHAALGEWESAEAIVSQDYSSVTCRGTIFHPNFTYEEGKPPVAIPPHHNPGRYKYKLSALQIAWVNEEYDVAEKACALISEEKARRQFLEVFPDGEIKKYDWDIKHAKALLLAVYAAVIKDDSINYENLDTVNDATKDALHAFYEYIRPTGPHEIGLVFDANIYVEALRLYDDQSDQQRGKFKSGSQETFWNIRVEEHIAALLPTAYLRLHAQGVGYDAHHHRGCTLSNDDSFFAFRQPAGFQIAARDFYVAYLGAAEDAESGRRMRGQHQAISIFSDLVSSKSRRGGQLMQQYAEPKTSKNLGC